MRVEVQPVLQSIHLQSEILCLVFNNLSSTATIVKMVSFMTNISLEKQNQQDICVCVCVCVRMRVYTHVHIFDINTHRENEKI